MNPLMNVMICLGVGSLGTLLLCLIIPWVDHIFTRILHDPLNVMIKYWQWCEDIKDRWKEKKS